MTIQLPRPFSFAVLALALAGLAACASAPSTNPSKEKTP